VKKRLKPKRWVEDKISSTDVILSQILQRVSIIESILENYIEMKKDTHKISKFLNKKREKKNEDIKAERDRRENTESY
jgi:hypothetical protein